MLGSVLRSAPRVASGAQPTRLQGPCPLPYLLGRRWEQRPPRPGLLGFPHRQPLTYGPGSLSCPRAVGPSGTGERRRRTAASLVLSSRGCV